MVSIINPEFFRFYTEKSKTGENALLNIFTDPKNIDLPQYKKDPFASFIVPGLNSNSDDEVINAVHDLELNQYSMYVDSEYDDITQEYGSDNRYHTLIFSPSKSITNKNIILAAIPCNGIVQPIPKSNNFKLYNASLIVMKNRPFKWNGEYYDKLIYLLIDLTTLFSFNEYVFTDNTSEFDYRKIRRHEIGLILYQSSNKHCTNYRYDEYALPCENRDDRKEFYEYSKKSMFYLSDIPKGIKLVNGGIKVEM